MKVSRSKTEYLCINRGNDNETVKMEDTKVPRIKEFKYLGSTVQESDDCERQWRAVNFETSHAISMPKPGHKIGFIQDQFSS